MLYSTDSKNSSVTNNSTNRELDAVEEDKDILHIVPTILKLMEIYHLSYLEFSTLLDQFNQLLETYTKDEPRSLRFTIVPGSGTGMFWKYTIRTQCIRISKLEQCETNGVILSLYRFLSIRHSITQRIAALEKCDKDKTRKLQNCITREILTSLSTTNSSLALLNDNECCICMDRQSNFVLSCTHAFCDDCVQRSLVQENKATVSTCPLCRAVMAEDSGFVFAEKPNYDEVKTSITESICKLPTDYYAI
ncbi:unnamed protein product [Rotaria magnacalcarata]|uniref:RING-type domain-containing protein n=2 Tax=Rotaria magnacalcarata TaxID=392030 RepID=A0A815Y4W1_9BILA|nr:unnamed protein product [Rotaria magnacalcarata]CAF1565615.1 unnamed protein product [Rotaria magnacalcarata]CAF2264104.1 unnamed protein product [Rotaria magnacalcarata]CAF3995990.1 unnamed protein product [Rotaria magnacalcarata]